MQNAVQVRAGEPIVLRFSIPHRSLELARIIQQRTNAQVNINGIATPPYTRVGPWRGENSEYGDHFGIELYWLVDVAASGNILILEMVIRETCLVHVKYREDVLLDVVCVLLACYALDDLAQDQIAQVGVGIARARLEGQPRVFAKQALGKVVEIDCGFFGQMDPGNRDGVGNPC